MTAVLRSNVAASQPATPGRAFPVWGMVAFVFAVAIVVAVVQSRLSTAPSGAIIQPLEIGTVVRVASGKSGDYSVYGAYNLAIHLDAGEQVRVVGRDHETMMGDHWFYQVVLVDPRGRPSDTPVTIGDIELAP